MKYVYESLDGKETFEISHPMKDDALTEHPELKIPIRRVITGGSGFSMDKVKSKTKLNFNDYKDSRFAKNLKRSRG